MQLVMGNYKLAALAARVCSASPRRRCRPRASSRQPPSRRLDRSACAHTFATQWLLSYTEPEEIAVETNASEFFVRAEERIERYNLLKHPFYTAWTAGELTREDLR